jgi:hypothetical protein
MSHMSNIIEPDEAFIEQDAAYAQSKSPKFPDEHELHNRLQSKPAAAADLVPTSPIAPKTKTELTISSPIKDPTSKASPTSTISTPTPTPSLPLPFSVPPRAIHGALKTPRNDPELEQSLKETPPPPQKAPRLEVAQPDSMSPAAAVMLTAFHRASSAYSLFGIHRLSSLQRAHRLFTVPLMEAEAIAVSKQLSPPTTAAAKNVQLKPSVPSTTNMTTMAFLDRMLSFQLDSEEENQEEEVEGEEEDRGLGDGSTDGSGSAYYFDADDNSGLESLANPRAPQVTSSSHSSKSSSPVRAVPPLATSTPELSTVLHSDRLGDLFLPNSRRSSPHLNARNSSATE